MICMQCRMCGSDEIELFALNDYNETMCSADVYWNCRECGTPHWATFRMDESTLGYDETYADPPETRHNHPSLTRAERNPGLTR